MSVRVLIVDDDVPFRETAAELVRGHGLAVVGMAGSISEALEMALPSGMEAALIDVHLPDGSGLDLAEELKAQGSGARVLLTSSDPEAVAGGDATDADAPGFVAKTDLATVDLAELLNPSGPPHYKRTPPR
jgi:two-component system, NarL family, response regulator DevR